MVIFYLPPPFHTAPAVHTLRDVIVTIPMAVRRNDNVQLLCQYDTEGDTLYSVKWYKGKREFYRYTPKENPAMKTFALGDINVVVSAVYNLLLSIAPFYI